MPRPNPFYDCGSVAPATPSSTSAALATVANATVVKNAEPVPVGSSYMRPTAATSAAPGWPTGSQATPTTVSASLCRNPLLQTVVVSQGCYATRMNPRSGCR